MSLKTINKFEFFATAKKDKYYATRWSYFEKVIKIIGAHPEWSSCLELGCYKKPVVIRSDLMDIEISDRDFEVKYVHDARKTPWPIEENKKYDLFIALQVWEHLYNDEKGILNGFQEHAFSEVVRISKNAILSFPYKWKHASKTHRKIDSEVIKKWTLGIKPQAVFYIRPKTKKAKKQSPGTRVIYFFRF